MPRYRFQFDFDAPTIDVRMLVGFGTLCATLLRNRWRETERETFAITWLEQTDDSAWIDVSVASGSTTQAAPPHPCEVEDMGDVELDLPKAMSNCPACPESKPAQADAFDVRVTE